MVLKDFLDSAMRRLGVSTGTDAATNQVPQEHVRLSNPWHSVAIQPGPKRCEAVTGRLGMRYLSRDAPKLPLKDCTEPACTCRYRHHDDRRLDGTALDRNGMPLPHPQRRDGD